MNRLIQAIKAFFKALKDPQEATLYLEGPPKNVADTHPNDAHLRLLALLQQSGRLIDFLKEDISSFDDTQIGAVVRDIHHNCSKTIEELVTIRPVIEENEGQTMTIAAGYDPIKIKLTGNIAGGPPFSGIVVHRGWKAHKKSLPKKAGEQSSDVVTPAEIEVR